uniref:WD_REPEATS_REGION domain-containing protein n=1 Tax=Syphacia muris TaxID=451379 RepID=A0A0N5ATE1_9BILA
MMHSELLDKIYGFGIPEELQDTLDLQQGTATCCKFNRWGSQAAIGCTDGRVYIVDCTTKTLAVHWICHAYPITALSWSRNGRRLLTASLDWTVCIWDVLDCTRIERFVYGSPVFAAMFNPRNENQILVLHLGSNPAVVDVNKKEQKEIIFSSLCDDDFGEVTAVAFDRRGNYIVTGSSKGRIAVYDSLSLEMVTFVKQVANHQIKNIVLTRREDYLITNSQDRVIRSYNFEDLLKMKPGETLDTEMKVFDTINKASWKSICVSGDGAYICGAREKSQALHIFERNTSSLMKILEGSKGESLHDVQWHPIRPIILSVATNGIVSIWAQVHGENWSAFAPDFTELDENATYAERESEFDEDDEDRHVSQLSQAKEEVDEEVDVVSVRESAVYCSSDDEDYDESSCVNDLGEKKGPLWYYPYAPEIEEPEENPFLWPIT